MRPEGPVLVTGAAGFVGRHVVTELDRLGVPAATLDHRWDDISQVEDVVRAARPVACLHLGWYAHPSDYLTAVGPNARSLSDTLELARLLAEHGVQRVVVAGTSAEYAPSTEPLHESSRIAPRTVYGSAKAICHELLRTSAGTRDLRLTWARLFNVTGPGESLGRILPATAHALLEGRPMALTEGTQVRDYVDVRDVAAALVALLDTSLTVVNVGTGIGTPLRAMLTALADVTGGHGLLQFGARPLPQDDNSVVVSDAGLLRGAVPTWPVHDVPSIAAAVVAHVGAYDDATGRRTVEARREPGGRAERPIE